MDSRSSSSRFPGFDEIYLIGEPGGSTAFRVELDIDIETGLRLTRREALIARKVLARWVMGRKVPGDIVRSTLASPWLVSDKVLEVLHESGLTGFATYEVEVRDRRGAMQSGYHGWAITGRCGPVLHRASQPLLKNTPGGTFVAYLGLFFDPETWDGSSLFMSADGTGRVFAVESVRRAFRKARIGNITFKPLTEVERLKVQYDMEIQRSGQ